MGTSLEDTENVFNALKAGATSYLTKSNPASGIMDAIHEAHKGGAPMTNKIAKEIGNFSQKKAGNGQ